MGFMGRQDRYSPEVRERAVRLVFEQQSEYES
jgi:transposase-like protein